MKYCLPVAVILAIVFAACNKVTVPDSVEDQLRKGNWKVATASLQLDPHIGVDTVINLYHDAPDCMRDDYFVFGLNFKGTQYNTDPCTPSETGEIHFRWELFPSDSGIHIWDASQTLFGRDDIKSPFIDYMDGRFAIRYTDYIESSIDPNFFDTLTFTYTFLRQ